MQLFPSSSAGVSVILGIAGLALTHTHIFFLPAAVLLGPDLYEEITLFFSDFMEFFICSAEPKPGEISSLALEIWSRVCMAVIQKSIMVWGGLLTERCVASACQDGTRLPNPASKKGVGGGVSPNRRTAGRVVGR